VPVAGLDHTPIGGWLEAPTALSPACYPRKMCAPMAVMVGFVLLVVISSCNADLSIPTSLVRAMLATPSSNLL